MRNEGLDSILHLVVLVKHSIVGVCQCLTLVWEESVTVFGELEVVRDECTFQTLQ